MILKFSQLYFEINTFTLANQSLIYAERNVTIDTTPFMSNPTGGSCIEFHGTNLAKTNPEFDN